METQFHRRQFLTALAALGAQGLVSYPALAASQTLFGPAEPFDLDWLRDKAKDLAKAEWQAPIAKHPDILRQIDYDAFQHIRFRPERSLLLGGHQNAPVQLFHLAKLFLEPVHMHLVDGRLAREVLYDPQLFETPADHPARQLRAADLGFAGFRVMAPDLKTDWLAFLGASYFRTSGPFNQYGISARGLAIDTAMPHPEEFPRFSSFWLEPAAKDDGAALTVSALLDSKSVTGAYRIETKRVAVAGGKHRIDMEIDATIFARKDVARLGIAPFSSMFWYGEGSRKQAMDWRPEIHDSDGLAILTGSGEHIWRPLNNPPRVMTSAFVDKDVKGFGLMQRDRDFAHYLDDGVFYERRASVWVEPLEDWGAGAVHLVEIPTVDETDDNIVAYWCPDEPLRAGQERRFRYRLSWLDKGPLPDTVGRTIATWTGWGGRPGQKRPAGVRKFVIDFHGPVFNGLGREDGVEIVVSTSRGTVINAYTHPVVDQHNRWRAIFDLKATGPDVVDLRAYLRKGNRALSETWIYQHFPEA